MNIYFTAWRETRCKIYIHIINKKKQKNYKIIKKNKNKKSKLEQLATAKEFFFNPIHIFPYNRFSQLESFVQY